MAEQKDFYRRHLPHWQPSDATFHVGFRLDGSLPAEVVERLRAEREEAARELAKVQSSNEEDKKEILQGFHWTQFEKFDELLDGVSLGPRWLAQPEAAAIVQKALHFYDQSRYDLLAYSIMSNHVHVVAVCWRRNSSVGSPDPTPAAEPSERGRNLILDGTGVPS